MKNNIVSLIEYTGSGHPDPAKRAACILIFAKSTRLEMKPGLLDEIQSWDKEKIYNELNYIANTIPSSWEFVDYTWLVCDVSRAFTHQFVRSRQFSFAQQTMRVLNVDGWTYEIGPSIQIGEWTEATDEEKKRAIVYNGTMNFIANAYNELIALGAEVEDARGVLPTNIRTNILAKCNLRTFVETVRKRSSPRTQGEYRRVLEEMKLSVLSVHPWLIAFINRTKDRATSDLDQLAKKWMAEQKISKAEMLTAIKLVDQIRGQ